MLYLLKQQNTGVTIQVKVSWKQGEGERSQNFVFNDAILQQYLLTYTEATDKYSGAFKLTLKGAENFENLTFEALIVSETGVTFSSK